MTITPSGEVGSVGVRMMHLDVSKAMEDAGLKVTELYSGDFKTEWSPYKALSEEAIGDMQKRLTATHTDFLNAVAGASVGPACPLKCAAIAWGKEPNRPPPCDDAMSHWLVYKIQGPREFYRSIVPTQEEPKRRADFGVSITRVPRIELERTLFGVGNDSVRARVAL